MSAESRRRFAAAVRTEHVDLGLACLLLAAEADRDADIDETVATGQARIRMWADLAMPLLRDPGAAPDPRGPRPLNPRDVAAALQVTLGEAGFHGEPGDYDDLRSSLLPEVLVRRRGLPILLSVVWLAVARQLGVDAYPVGLPGHVVVGIGTPDLGVLVDPFDHGKELSVHDAAAKVRAAGVPFTREHLTPTPPTELLLRVLTNIRLLGARTERPRTRLWAVELSLLLPHHSVALRRERGELLARVGDFAGGAAELLAYADAVEPVEPATAAAARSSAFAARARLN